MTLASNPLAVSNHSFKWLHYFYIVYDDGGLSPRYRSTDRFSVQRNGSLTIQPVKLSDTGFYRNTLDDFYLIVIGKYSVLLKTSQLN